MGWCWDRLGLHGRMLDDAILSRGSRLCRFMGGFEVSRAGH